MADQLACRSCGHYAVACDDAYQWAKAEIESLKAQLTECRDKALEEAEKVVEMEAVDAKATGSDEDKVYNLALEHAAGAIRSLKGTKP